MWGCSAEQRVEAHQLGPRLFLSCFFLFVLCRESLEKVDLVAPGGAAEED